MEVIMLRLTFSTLLLIFLSACGSEEAPIISSLTDEPEEIISENAINAVEPHAYLSIQKRNISAIDNCTLTKPLYLADRIEDLNALSQEMFALDSIEGVNGYANFIVLAQLALTSNTHTSELIEQLGLSGITESEQWFDVFCYLDNTTPTNTLSISMAEDWLIRDDFYTSLIQKFEANFTSRSIDPEKDLWRLSLNNAWQIETQLTIDVEATKYVYYKSTEDAPNQIAHALVVKDSIYSASNEFGDYFSISNESDYIVHIIMPTFAQYPYVKSNIIDVLNGFKALEKMPQNELYIPYFSEAMTKDGFINFSTWLTENSAQTLLDDENQDYSGINQYEMFKLMGGDDYNSFIFNDEGKITVDYNNTIDVEALFYVEESFNPTYNSGVIFTAGGGIEVPIFECEEEVEFEINGTWRPYFMLIENAKNGLIYSIVTNGSPRIERQNNACINDIGGGVVDF